MKHVVTAVAAGVALVLVLALAVVSTSASAVAACLPDDVAVRGTVPADLNLDAEQSANARTIVAATIERRLPTRAAVIAVATALQESSLRNLPHGDADSVGLFQQRPSAGWGRPAQLMDPALSTDLFLSRLEKVAGWQALPLAEAAQTVQRSAHPQAYSRWEPTATAIVAGLLGRPPGADADPTDATDLPGLAVYGDDLLRTLGRHLPATYLGGPIVVDVRPTRTVRETRSAVRHNPGLPGTLVVSVSDSFDSPAAVEHLMRDVSAVLRHTGPTRTVYWLTQPVPTASLANAALRALADRHPGLQVVEVAPSGSRADEVNRVAAVQKILELLGLSPWADPTASQVPGCDDGLGGYSRVPVADCAFHLPKGNPRSCQDAMRWALAQADGAPVWHRRCLNFTARAYGYTASGVPSAAEYWADAYDRHPHDPHPPAGSLVFWATGEPAGHAALSLGGGMVVSNDIAGKGTIAAVPLTYITEQWSARYLGWAPPFFPRGV
ncbi:hypothetical protein GCM10009547_34890 [Sporichthya brevicatena]|uniref:Uncharacterized protein n=1 Tax=Sporichthya brevicatena TaxID=171442 RepID=A0ABP3S7R7_9ACTN